MRPASTAAFHTQNGRTELDENLADMLDVIGKFSAKHDCNTSVLEHAIYTLL